MRRLAVVDVDGWVDCPFLGYERNEDGARPRVDTWCDFPGDVEPAAHCPAEAADYTRGMPQPYPEHVEQQSVPADCPLRTVVAAVGLRGAWR